MSELLNNVVLPNYSINPVDLLCDLFYNRLNGTLSRSVIPKGLLNIDDKILDDMWNYDKNELIIIMFYVRSHKKKIVDKNYIRGLGNKKVFYQFIKWMSYNKIDELNKILLFIPNYGCWKDLLFLLGTPIEPEIINIFSNQLKLDYDSYTTNGLISMVSKWVPNENSSFDKKYKIFHKI